MGCLPLLPHIAEAVTDKVILSDEENIYISPAAFDSFIIPRMDTRIKHRPLVKILYSYKILTGEYHYCCRLQFTDASLQKQQIYRYRISRSILSHESQISIDKAANAEFFHDISKASINNFLPLIQDRNTYTWAGRIIESGAKANNHVLITGESASGKSYMMIRTAAYLAELGERVILFDSSVSNTKYELKNALSEEFINKNVEIYDLENDKFPIDPFAISGLNRKDSKANYIFNILSSVVYEASEAQNSKLKTLIYENIDTLEKNGTVSPDSIQKILVKDGSTISSLRDKLIPLLITLNDNINYEKTWADYLESNKKIIVFSVTPPSKQKGEIRFDIILASLYQYHIKHRYSNLWLCIDEIYNQNLKEDGVINKIFTQGRKSMLNIIGATQGFSLSHTDEWTTLNNAKTKVFFKPLSTSIVDVMKELNMSQSKRSEFAHMQQGECIISSELYSAKTKTNQPAIVSGKVSEKFKPLKEIYPAPPVCEADVPQPPNRDKSDKTNTQNRNTTYTINSNKQTSQELFILDTPNYHIPKYDTYPHSSTAYTLSSPYTPNPPYNNLIKESIFIPKKPSEKTWKDLDTLTNKKSENEIKNK